MKPNGGEPSEGLINDLATEGNRVDSGEFTKDISQEIARARIEAETAEGALSEPGFAVIKEALSPLTQELDKLEKLAKQDSDDPKMQTEYVEKNFSAHLRAYAEEWTKRLDGLISKLDVNARSSLSEKAYSAKSNFLGDVDYESERSKRMLNRIGTHINRGLWLAAQTERLSMFRERKIWRLPAWMGVKEQPSNAFTYAQTVAHEARRFPSAKTDLLKMVIDEPMYDRFSKEAGEFPIVKRFEIKHGGKTGGDLARELESSNIFDKDDYKWLSLRQDLLSRGFEGSIEKVATNDQFVIFENSKGYFLPSDWRWKNIKDDLKPNIFFDLLLDSDSRAKIDELLNSSPDARLIQYLIFGGGSTTMTSGTLSLGRRNKQNGFYSIEKEFSSEKSPIKYGLYRLQ